MHVATCAKKRHSLLVSSGYVLALVIAEFNSLDSDFMTQDLSTVGKGNIYKFPLKLGVLLIMGTS